MRLFLKDAVLEYESGKYVLKEKSKVNMNKAPSFLKHTFSNVHTKIINKKINDNNEIIEDIECSSLSQACSIVLGRSCNGRTAWKNEDGTKAEDLIDFFSESSSTDDKVVLEEFLRDIEVLDSLENYSSQFNPFDVLNIIDNEIRHSNVLGWLLDPNETHEIDNEFLIKLIRDIYKENENSNVYNHLKLSEVFLMDFEDVEVRREWKNIDLLVISNEQKFILMIENKIWSEESKTQLSRYYDIIKDDFKGYNVMPVFLTPELKEPSDDRWGIYSYLGVLNILDKITIKIPRESTKTFIRQYTDILRRKIVGNQELEKLCLDIYRKHKRALDLIYENKPDQYSQIYELVKGIIENSDELKLDHHTKSNIKFYVELFDEKLKKESINWTSTKRLLLFEVENSGDTLKISLKLGPCEQNVRIGILNFFDKHYDDKKRLLLKVMRNGVPKGTKYTSIYTRRIVTSSSYKDLDYEGFEKKIQSVFKDFIKKDLEELKKIINEISWDLISF